MLVTQLRSCARRIGAWVLRIERDGVALGFACKHRKTPLAIKALCAFALVYVLNPTDLYSDFNPVLGFVDDFLLVPGLIWLTIKLLPRDVLAECRDQATAWMEQKGKWRVRLGIGLAVAAWSVAAFAISQAFRSAG